MNKNYPIYKTTFIDDMRSLVEEAAQNFPDSIAIQGGQASEAARRGVPKEYVTQDYPLLY
jgi:hypothetical protein